MSEDQKGPMPKIYDFYFKSNFKGLKFNIRLYVELNKYFFSKTLPMLSVSITSQVMRLFS